jgi:hypothetical protein
MPDCNERVPGAPPVGISDWLAVTVENTEIVNEYRPENIS